MSNLRRTTSATAANLLLCLILLVVVVLCSTLCAAHEEEDWDYPDDDGWRSATATYAKDTNGSIMTDGACGYGDLHKSTIYGNYTSALSPVLFNRGRVCGSCYEIRCIDNIRWCLPGSQSVFVTATDYCAPNEGLSSEYGGWCNVPNEHFEMSKVAFAEIAKTEEAAIVPVQYRRVGCERDGGIRFTLSGGGGEGGGDFFQVLITNVGSDGEVVGVKVRGEKTGWWVPMARNWGQFWHSNAHLEGQVLSFQVMTGNRKSVTCYNVAPKDWKSGQTFQGKQIYDD